MFAHLTEQASPSKCSSKALPRNNVRTTQLDALSQLDVVDQNRSSYRGESMGTMFGSPYVASNARIQVAVLSKIGMTSPLQLTRQWDDKRFERRAARASRSSRV